MKNKWSDDINSFNSFSIMYHSDKLEQLARDEICTPIAVDIDVSNECNHDCFFCNSKYFRNNTKNKLRKLPYNHLMNILDIITNKWKSKSICFGGGGEPLTNKENFNPFIPKCIEKNLDVGIVTNGSLIDKEFIECCDKVRFLGISFDASTEKTYKKIRGVNHLKKVLKNIYLSSKYGNIEDICGKILVNHLNYNEIYDMCKLLKEHGVNSVHLRPTGIDNVLDENGEKLSLKIDNKNKKNEKYTLEKYINTIETQVNNAIKDFEDENFKIYFVGHCYQDDSTYKVDFEKCRITPTNCVFAADGNLYLCINMRGRDGFRLCSHYPDAYNVLNYWGTPYHKQLIDNIDPKKCMRCSKNNFNKIIEKAIIQDKMFKNFM